MLGKSSEIKVYADFFHFLVVVGIEAMDKFLLTDNGKLINPEILSKLSDFDEVAMRLIARNHQQSSMKIRQHELKFDQT